MKKVEYKDHTRIIIIETTDNIDQIHCKIRGEHSDLFCVPIEYINNIDLYYKILPNIKIGEHFYGGIFYYADLEQLDKLLKPVTITMKNILISEYDSIKGLLERRTREMLN